MYMLCPLWYIYKSGVVGHAATELQSSHPLCCTTTGACISACISTYIVDTYLILSPHIHDSPHMKTCGYNTTTPPSYSECLPPTPHVGLSPMMTRGLVTRPLCWALDPPPRMQDAAAEMKRMRVTSSGRATSSGHLY